MAVDSAEKRYSMIEFGDGSMGMMFEVDSSVDLDDRQHLLGCYSGIAFSGPVIEPVIPHAVIVYTPENWGSSIATGRGKNRVFVMVQKNQTAATAKE